jgi:parallel beta-helix repeat protein
MKPKALTLLLVICLALSTMVATSFTLPAKADPYMPVMVTMQHGYIRNNGTVDPPLLPIERQGDIYTLTADIVNFTIEIQRDNVILDGNGFSLTLPPIIETRWDWEQKSGDSLIQISNKENIIIKNIKSDNYFSAISVMNCSNIAILQNTLASGRLGIYIYSSANCTVAGNQLIENSNTGCIIQKSSFMNIEYNNISRNSFHGSQIEHLSNSNISRNNFCENFLQGSPGIGLSVTGLFLGNRVFENNFINNSVGLDFHCIANSTGNLLYNNYWSNYHQEIYDYHGYVISGSDETPLKIPISTYFDLAQYPLSFPTPTNTPVYREETLAIFWAATALVLAVSVIIGLVYITKKHSSSKQMPIRKTNHFFTQTC